MAGVWTVTLDTSVKADLHRLLKQLAQAADALRFADAGKPRRLVDSNEVLGVTQAQAGRHPKHPQSVPSPKRQIALAAERQLLKPTLCYALNVCERLDADLEVLVGPGIVDVQQAIDLVRQGRSVRYRIKRLDQDFLREVARYAWTNAGLLFVVVGAGDGLAERVAEHDSGRLGIPSQVSWVVVREEHGAA